ncbi:hypothetical protein ACTXGU_00050 [Niallia sp. 01092]|uniref:hypothetical protein n=1 Tax=Niallia sp. 01092 TaxID=3457759 RepID=UPI003FD36087
MKKIKALNGRTVTEEDQDFQYPLSWSKDEILGFMDDIFDWILHEDHYYNLYKYLRETHDHDGGEFPNPTNEYTEKFEKLYHKFLKEEEMIELFEQLYKEEKVINEQRRKIWEMEQMVKAKVQGGVN